MKKLDIDNIGLSEECIKFLRERLESNDYRGWHYSQHNRYTFKDVIKIFNILYEFIKEDFLIIRTTDVSKRRWNRPEEKLYAKICKKIHKAIKKGTQDSIRKNFFVDFDRMELLERYDKEEKMVEKKKKSMIYKVKVSSLGLKLINSSNEVRKYYVYSEAVGLLFDDSEIITSLIRIMKRMENYLRMDEFQFFVSFLGKRDHSEEIIIDFCLNYRKQKREWREEKFKKKIREYCDSTQAFPKKDKRNFHNWENGARQSFCLLGTTAYFEFDKKGKRLLLKIKGEKKYRRSKVQRNKYFLEHNVSRKPKERKFQIHHIIPLYICEKDRKKLKLIDAWENMVYITASKHQELNKEEKRGFVVLSSTKNGDLILSNVLNERNKVILRNDKDILYNPKKKKILLEYNRIIRPGILEKISN